MSGLACQKKIICREKAQGLLKAVINMLNDFEGAGDDFVTEASEIAIDSSEDAIKKIMKLNEQNTQDK